MDELVGTYEPFSIARYQPAAVMFVGFVSFTERSREMGPQNVIAFLREPLATLSDSVFAHDGIIDKFLGDGLWRCWVRRCPVLTTRRTPRIASPEQWCPT